MNNSSIENLANELLFLHEKEGFANKSNLMEVLVRELLRNGEISV